MEPQPRMHAYPLEWVEPLALACALPHVPLVLLYSGVQAGYSGRHSLLACDAEETITARDFTTLESFLTTGKPRFENAWFGWLGYGLKNTLENLPVDSSSFIDLPPAWLARFRRIYHFDHEARALTCHSYTPQGHIYTTENSAPQPPKLKTLESSMTRAEYLQKAGSIIEAIHAGDFYQANLTRKFHGEFAETPDSLALFERLCAVSPAPYSAYFRLENAAILSSSPERFLTLSSDGRITSRPIKGSAARGKTAQEDARLRENLAASVKDRAENLMIVDLMRNDLARACEAGSVRVEALHEVTTHATVHHLSSTVSGRRRADVSPLRAVAACFPPGSMTGAPKIEAMRRCSELEQMARGVYSGALGWFGGDGSADLSVVIRTLIVQGTRFEFQVGGGIVADSTPEGEWEETIIKARGIAKTLGIAEESLKSL